MKTKSVNGRSAPSRVAAVGRRGFEGRSSQREQFLIAEAEKGSRWQERGHTEAAGGKEMFDRHCMHAALLPW